MATETEILKPPVASIGLVGWLRKNLFSGWFNSSLTLATLYILYLVLTTTWEFVAGVRWGIVTANLKLFMVGRYPPDQLWRVQICVSLVVFLFGASWGAWRGIARQIAIALAALFATLALVPFETSLRIWLGANVALIAVGFALGYFTHARRVLTLAWLLSIPVVFILLYGFGALPAVSTDQWGGLLLTVTLAVVGIVASFPLGVLLAVGRTSTYPAIRYFCILWIEVIRGVPLVTIIFMAQVMLPLFLPEGFSIERVVKSMAAFTIFTSAYLAETVRGGLQAIPHGQGEAAKALGLNPLQSLYLIILPQALRAVIPALVGQFISLFKDTSLVAIVGLLDLAGVAQAAANQKDFLGHQPEAFLFIAAIYFVFSFSMSQASRRLEKSLGVGER